MRARMTPLRRTTLHLFESQTISPNEVVILEVDAKLFGIRRATRDTIRACLFRISCAIRTVIGAKLFGIRCATRTILRVPLLALLDGHGVHPRT